MNGKYIIAELSSAREEIMGSKKQAKGAMGKIREHAKKYGEQAVSDILDALDGDLSRSREWSEMQADLFRVTAIEAMKTKLEKAAK